MCRQWMSDCDACKHPHFNGCWGIYEDCQECYCEKGST